MKMIIISPDGSRKDFKYDEFAEFHFCLFACLCGSSKRVEVEIDERSYNVIFHIYFD